MTQTTDFDRLLTSWMEADGPQDIPQRVVAAAFSEARGIEQRRDITGAVIRLFPRSGSPNAEPRTGRRRIGPLLLVTALICLLVVGAVLVGSQLLKPSPALLIRADGGVFVLTGSAHEPRGEDTATLLRDGRVLVVGGYDAQTSAEL
jgi:hypothetical protein